ncbi:hypothetical protein ACL02O_12715 [Micromonospora sp. MS34]|uniref:hypothetical protein n=1 Tax=Micromonospora sp. MS34 TaxID=3385971 RepID=UPI0039A337DE
MAQPEPLTPLAEDRRRALAVVARGLGDGGVGAEEFLEGPARPAGTRLGVRYGAAFEVFRLG